MLAASAVTLYLFAFVGFLIAIFVITMSGYFFVRVILKILGLHKEEVEQVKDEKKLAMVLGIIILIAIIVLIAGFFGPDPDLTMMGTKPISN